MEETAEVFPNLHSSPNIIRDIEPRIMGWMGHVARVGRDEVRIWFWWENLRERDRFEDIDIRACIYKRGSP